MRDLDGDGFVVIEGDKIRWARAIPDVLEMREADPAAGRFEPAAGGELAFRKIFGIGNRHDGVSNSCSKVFDHRRL